MISLKPTDESEDLSHTSDDNSVKETVVDIQRWVDHFVRNQKNRSVPNWNAPVNLSPTIVAKLVRSLEQFELGDGGGPDSLIAWNADSFQCETEMRKALIDMWFIEEKEHSRLLGGLVRRFGGTPIRGHWSFSVFCLVRRLMGVNFELTVLLLTEISSTAYYRLLKKHVDDTALQTVCALILGDEAGHVAFHRDRLARRRKANYGLVWELIFRALGYSASTMLWINHAAALKAAGATTPEYYKEVGRELGRFVNRLRNETERYSA